VVGLVDLGTLSMPEEEEDSKDAVAKDSDSNGPSGGSDSATTSPSSSTSTLLVARGGLGGEGTAVNGNRRLRRPRQPPQGGERKTLKLTLKIVADVALVGVPNCGKSTFLAAVTRAKPKIANYPFTTIVPNLGTWIPASAVDQKGAGSTSAGGGSCGALVLCDVPGLIAGAARGVGLGHAFLRHVERCHVLLHVLDATAHDPVADYVMLNREIMRYNGNDSESQLAQLPQVVVVNKVDAYDDYELGEEDDDGGSGGDDDSSSSRGRRRRIQNESEQGLRVRTSRDELEARLREVLPHSRLLWMSAREGEGVDDLMTRLAAFVQKVKDTKTKATTTTIAAEEVS